MVPLLRGHLDLAGVIEFPRRRMRGWRRSPAAALWMAREPRRTRPDVALDFQGLFRSGLIARCSGAAHRVGLSDSREGSRIFHSVRVPVVPGRHAVDRYRALVAALGVDVTGPAVFDLPPGQPVDGLPDRSVVLHPFSRGEEKSLSGKQVERFCHAVDRPVVLLGRVDEAERARLRLPRDTVDLLNETSIPQLITILRDAEAVISVDSGPMHLAAALQPRRVLGLHTWSDPRKVGPYPREAWVWKAGRLRRRRALSGEICEQVRPFWDEDVNDLMSWSQALIEGKLDEVDQL